MMWSKVTRYEWDGWAYLERVLGKGFSEEVTFELGPDGQEGASAKALAWPMELKLV